MEPQNPPVTPQPAAPPPPAPPVKPARSMSKIIIILLGIIILLLIGVIGYLVMQPKDIQTAPSPTPTPFDQEGTPSPTDTPTPTPAQVSTLDEDVQKAIESKSFASLDEYLAPTVHVVLHASECCGPTSKEATIKQLDYLDDAKSPWNWNQEDPTIKKIKGQYKDTFGKGTVGIAQNEKVISYETKDNQIVGIYISATYKIMVQ